MKIKSLVISRLPQHLASRYFVSVRQRRTVAKLGAGFTIIELIFATVIFSLVMTVILVTAFQVGRIYYKGVSITNTDVAARRVVEGISNDVKFANTATVIKNYSGLANAHYFCVGWHRYTYVLYKKVTNDAISQEAQNPNNTDYLTGVVQDDITGGCVPPSVAGNNAKQLLGPDMQLNNLVFNCANGACTVGVHVIFYGADDTVFLSRTNPGDTPAQALLAADATCSGNLLSSQFCAAVDLQTKVLQRI